MNKEKWKKWEKVRAKGRTRFIWLNGVVGWGIPLAVTGPALTVLWRDAGFVIERFPWGSFLRLLPSSLIVASLGGYFYGVLMWEIAERMYRKEKGIK